MGTPKTGSFAHRIRTAIRELARRGEKCTVEAISIQAVLTNRADNGRLRTALRDLVKGGEIAKIAPGLYALSGAQAPHPPEIREVMWRVLRMRRAVTVEDLMEMAGASRAYAAEWLHTLEKHGVVRREGDSFRLIRDSVEMPEIRDNAEKIAAWRGKKKAALAALAQAEKAIAQARAAINEI